VGPALFLLALFLLLMAAALWRLARRSRAASGLPRGKVVYVDGRNWRKPPEPLRAPRYGLAGRPDYLMREGKAIIPVEAKPSRQTPAPYEADLLQLAAYCLLVEETYQARPPHGLLVYQDCTWEIPFDAGLRQRLLDTLAEMRQACQQAEVARSHDQPARCAACSMRGHCGEEALA
jgi:CRISPR-associated exonuclease Cas4